MATCPICHGPLGGRWGNRCYQCHPGGLPRTGTRSNCLICGASIYRQANEIRRPGAGRYCSRECRHAALRGVERVTGTTYIRKDGYRIVKVGVHQYRLEHRLVMETVLRRPLGRREEVHHINGDKLDNRVENLLVVSPSVHQAYHPENARRQRSRLTFTCHECGKPYERKASRANETKYCSGSCRSRAVSRSRWAKAQPLT